MVLSSALQLLLLDQPGLDDLEFGLLPLYRINNKLVEDIDAYSHSIIFSLVKEKGLMKNFFLPLIEKFIANPKLIFFKDLDALQKEIRTKIGKLM